MNNSFFVLAFKASEFDFVKTGSSNHGAGTSEARDVLEFDDGLGAVDEIDGEGGAFVVGAFGGRVAADAVADSVDVFGRSLEEFVDGNAGRGIFDFGVFETVI